jgi:hypothetical protein
VDFFASDAIKTLAIADGSLERGARQRIRKTLMAKAPAQKPATNPDVSSADVHSIRRLFLLGRFEPARAQRDYQWERPQWSDFLSDMENAFRIAGNQLDAPQEQIEEEAPPPPPAKKGGKVAKEPVADLSPVRKLAIGQALSHYYLGHVLLMPRTDASQFLIYDGQQRLTTITLLLCALRDGAGGDGDWYPIQQVLRTPPPENLPRLTIATRGGALKRIGESLNGTTPPSNRPGFIPADYRMYEAAQFFLARTKDWAPAKRETFANFVLDSVFVTLTQIRDRRVAEYAYITINTRGRALENKDIVKGHFVQLASQLSLGEANDIADEWKKLEQKAGRHLDQILRMTFMIDYREAAAFDFGAQIMDYFADEKQLPEVRNWLSNRLFAITDLHRKLILDPARIDVLEPPLSSIRRMTFLPWEEWQALAFRFAERDDKAPVRFAQSIQALERWCFSMNLLDVSDRRLVEAMIQAMNQIDDKKDPFGHGGVLRMSAAYRERVVNRLADGQITDSARRGAHVRWLETLYWPASAVNFAATNGSSVEHVLPQRPTDQWLKDFPQAINIHAEQFGNLCLIPKALNEGLGNDQYQAKRKALKGLAIHYKSAHEVAKSTIWTMATVQARNDKLKALAVAALGLK